MTEVLHALLFDYTVRNVALGAAVLGVAGGALGCFAVLRRQGLYGDALAHATLPGVAAAFLLTGTQVPLVLLSGAAASAGLGAWLVVAVVGATRIKQDAALGIVLSVFFGFGTVLLTHLAGTAGAGQSGLDSFIFGQAATIVAADVVTTATLAALALAVVALLFKEFTLLAFDPVFAASTGYRVGRLNALLTGLVVVAIIVGIRTVGVVLVAAMLITPAVAARQWTDRLGVMIWVSMLVGATSGVVGALVSASDTGLPTGPLVVLIATALLALSLLLGTRHGIVWDRLRARRHRRSALWRAPGQRGAAAGTPE